MGDRPEPAWPVDLNELVRLWPMEGEDGSLLQELFDDLRDFEPAFGMRGAADAVGTFLSLPEGYGYESKLLVGLWRDGGLAGALDCIVGYPDSRSWTLGLLVVADRHRHAGVGSAVLRWLEDESARRGARTVRGSIARRNGGGIAFAERNGYAIAGADDPDYVIASKTGPADTFPGRA